MDMAGMGLSEWEQPEFKLGQTTFRVRKLLARDAFSLLEALRPHLNAAIEQAGVNTLEGENAAVKALGRVILALPPEAIALAREQLFRAVWFTDANRGEPICLHGRDDEAIQNPFHYYAVIGRAFAHNFLPYWGEIASLLPGAAEASPPSDTGTSPPSSQPP